MVADPKWEALFALHRFGFGPRTGSPPITADPRGALLTDIERPGAAALTVNMPSSGEAARAALKVREARRAARLARETTKTADPTSLVIAVVRADRLARYDHIQISLIRIHRVKRRRPFGPICANSMRSHINPSSLLTTG